MSGKGKDSMIRVVQDGSWVKMSVQVDFEDGNPPVWVGVWLNPRSQDIFLGEFLHARVEAQQVAANEASAGNLP